MKGFLNGSATAMITPFDRNGVNFSAMEKMIEYQLAGGTDALVVLGTTGEPCTMSEAEKTSLIRFAIEKVNGRAKVIIGSGANDTLKAIDASRRAEDLGADGVLAVTPYYNKCTQKGLILYYERIANAVKIPVICYNVPSRTGVNLLPETMSEIADLPNIAGIKEASGKMEQVQKTASLVLGRCDLYSGEDALNLDILNAGGCAVISVVSNLAPALVKQLTSLAKTDLKKAKELSDRLAPLSKACFIEVNPIPVKAGMNLLGFEAGEPREPLTPIEREHIAPLREAMRAAGLEVKA